MNDNPNNTNPDFDEIHEGERWLAGIAAPAPSVRALASAKAAMRAEFARLGRRSDGVARWRAWHGALAAAACIGLCVIAGWQLPGQPAPVNSVELADKDVAWPVEVETQLLALGQLDEDLSAIEEAAPADGAMLYDVLSDAVGAAESSGPAGSSMRTPASGSNQSEETI